MRPVEAYKECPVRLRPKLIEEIKASDVLDPQIEKVLHDWIEERDSQAIEAILYNPIQSLWTFFEKSIEHNFQIAIFQLPNWTAAVGTDVDELINRLLKSNKSDVDQFILHLVNYRIDPSNNSIRLAAKQIVKADQKDWFKSIRTFVMEVCTSYEIEIINDLLIEFEAGILETLGNADIKEFVQNRHANETNQ